MTRSIKIALLFLVSCFIFTAGCGRPKEDSADTNGNKVTSLPAGPQQDLYVMVPCGIAGPYGEIKELFEKQYPNIKIKQNVANIDVQTKMILDGKDAPDVWISLGDREVMRVKDKGLIDGKPTTYAFNSIAFLVQRDNPSGLDAVTGLTSDKIKTIAVPDENNSSGYYAKQAFNQSGIYDQIQKKLWLTPEPSQVKAQLSKGKADVGVVYYPCTRETRVVGGKQEEMKGKIQLLGKIPADISGPIPAQAAVIKGAANTKAGHQFLKFLLTDEVQDIWEKWAFDRVKQPASGKRTVLYMYCGAGIRPFMDKATEAFIAKNPKVRIDVGYAGSGCLLSQLKFAQRGDLYMPGEDFYLNQAKERNYIKSQELVGYFEPVILVQKGNPKGIKTLQDLTKSGMRIALGEPEAAAIGYASEQLLKKANLLAPVKKNTVFTAGNVPELGNAVKLKSVDAALVWKITAMQVLDDCDIVEIDKQYYKPSNIPIGLLNFTKDEAIAKSFIEFLLSPEIQKLAADNGLTPAKP